MGPVGPSVSLMVSIDCVQVGSQVGFMCVFAKQCWWWVHTLLSALLAYFGAQSILHDRYIYWNLNYLPKIPEIERGGGGGGGGEGEGEEKSQLFISGCLALLFDSTLIQCIKTGIYVYVDDHY